jgi:UPF0042 nucleotide-binding protein
MEILIITGMSGAGKSTALNYFEDRGYLTVNNMPYFLIDKIEFFNYKKSLKKMVMGIDVRSFENSEDFFKIIEKLKKENITPKIIYFEAKDDVILNRYNLTRRFHPLEDGASMTENIIAERKKLEDIREIADVIIDTSELKPKELVSRLKKTFEDDKIRDMVVTITTFGFKYGAPTDLDMMFDVRCLPNPYYIPELRVKTGNDMEIQDYVMNGSGSREYLEKIEDMIDFLLPHFIKEGKTQLTIGIGCSGGKHRSVTIANKLSEHIGTNENIKVLLHHKEKDKWSL